MSLIEIILINELTASIKHKAVTIFIPFIFFNISISEA